MNLSQHFTLEEMVFSEIATRRGIDNTPTTQIVDNLRELCVRLLEPARTAMGALRITSGYRSPSVNTLIGGAPNSQHTTGQAADLVPVEHSLEAVFQWMRGNLGFDQLIREFPPGGWIHLSWAGVPRGNVLCASKTPAGETRYTVL